MNVANYLSYSKHNASAKQCEYDINVIFTLLCYSFALNGVMISTFCLPKAALPDWGCELWFVGVQESIVKDEVNIVFCRKDYQLRYFFHNWSLPASKSIEQKSRLLENCIFGQETLSECPLFIMFIGLFCFIQNKGVRDCPRQTQEVRR